MSNKDTIFALGSGAGRAAIAVLRLSGPLTAKLVASFGGGLPSPRVATLTMFRHPISGEMLDIGLLLWFPGPSSFTGEDCAEFHVHGSSAVIAAMFQALGSFADARPAEPGEFTKRAFINGKLDLAQVEGLADLIEAETQAQRRQAMRQMQGALGAKVQIWRATLLEAAALLEADIDFADEADTPNFSGIRIEALLRPLLESLEAELSAGRAAELVREGLTIVIAGPPNAGKSTLLNALARRDVAIVSPIPGTTRDAIEVRLDLGGLALTLVDTAGLRDSADPIEQIGIWRAQERLIAADLVLWLNEAGSTVAPPDEVAGLSTLWPILTKADLASAPAGETALCISAATGENLDTLLNWLETFAKGRAGEGHVGLLTRARHKQACEMAAEAIGHTLADPTLPVEFIAEDVRLATRALEGLVGRVDVEDVLGEIFSRFCIGK